MSSPSSASSSALFASAHVISRKRRYVIASHDDILRLFDMLKRTRATGRVEFDFSQGTCASASVEEKVDSYRLTG
jgi:hypothetical protein